MDRMVKRDRKKEKWCCEGERRTKRYRVTDEDRPKGHRWPIKKFPIPSPRSEIVRTKRKIAGYERKRKCKRIFAMIARVSLINEIRSGDKGNILIKIEIKFEIT